MRTSGHYIKQDGSVEPSTKAATYLFGHDGVKILTLDDEDDWVMARNSHYSFFLVRPKDSPTWKIRELLPTSELNASHVVDRYLRRSFFPDFLYRRDSLLDAIKKPYFELKSIQHEPTDEFPLLHRVEFGYEHPYQPTRDGYHYNWVQNGTLWLDAANCWVMVNSNVEYLGSNEERSLHSLTFEFGEATDAGIRLPTRRIDYDDLPPKWEREGQEHYILEYEPITLDDFDAQMLTLSYYGLGEPVFDDGDEHRIVSIEAEDQNLEFGVNELIEFPFTLRNVSRDHVTLVGVLAC